MRVPVARMTFLCRERMYLVPPRRAQPHRGKHLRARKKFLASARSMASDADGARARALHRDGFLQGATMTLKLLEEKGCAIERQRMSWREIVQKPISKLDDDAFTRVRVILMNGMEVEALRFGHACARMNQELRQPLATVRRIEQQQATAVNWLIGPDHSPL